MNPHPGITTVVAVTALALGGALQAQKGSSEASAGTAPGASSYSPGSTSVASYTLGGISRVTGEEVRQQFTAKDLIGAEVYDRIGDKIGDITDLSLARTPPSGLAVSQARNPGGDADPPASPGTLMVDAFSPSGIRTTSDASSLSNARSPGNSVHPAPPIMSALSVSIEPKVFISVSGLRGIGDDMVSVAASQLTYNPTKQRYELSASKADVVALVEQEKRSGAHSARSSSTEGPRATTTGKPRSADEAARVLDALVTDSKISGFAYKVTVKSDNEGVELHGTVDSEEQHQQILHVARNATISHVEDRIQVEAAP